MVITVGLYSSIHYQQFMLSKSDRKHFFSHIILIERMKDICWRKREKEDKERAETEKEEA